MKINFKAQNVSVTPAVTDYLEKRLSTLMKFSKSESDGKPGSADREIVIDVDADMTTRHHRAGEGKFLVKAEFNMGKLHLHAEATDAELYDAIDILKDELVRELVSSRKRRTNLIRWGGQKIKRMLRGWGRDVDEAEQPGDEA